MNVLRKHPVLGHVLKFILAFAILAWLFKSGKIDFAALKMVWMPIPFLIIFSLVTLSYLAVTVRWRWLLRSQNLHISFFETFKLSLIGVFFSFALPGGVSGDLVKGYYIARDQQEKKWAAAISVVMDRFLGVTALMVMALTVMLFDSPHVFADHILRGIFLMVLGLLLFCIVVGYFLFSERGYNSKVMLRGRESFAQHEKLMQFLHIGHLYGRDKKVLTKVLLISLAGQICGTLMFVYAGSLMESDLRWSTYFYCVPIGMMLTAIPISPGGVGVGQAAFYFLFNLYSGKRTDLGPTLATIYQIFSFILGLAGAGFYLQHQRGNLPPEPAIK